MAVLDRFIAWCKQGQDSIWQQLELLESGKMGTYEVNETSRTDTTATTIEQLKSGSLSLMASCLTQMSCLEQHESLRPSTEADALNS